MRSDAGGRDGDHPLSPAERREWALEAYVRSARALMHFETLEGLVLSVCEAITAHGQYRLAAVAMTDDQPDRPLRMLAMAGEATGYLQGLELSASPTAASGSGPTGRSLRSGEPVVMGDCRNDPAFEPWRDRAERAGIRSTVTVPFKLGGVVRGVMLVYAPRPHAFGAGEMDLFQDLAQELAFAFTVHEDRQRLAAAEQALIARARDYQLLADNSSDVIIRYDRHWRMLYVSPSVSRLGYRPENLLGLRTRDFVHPDDLPRGAGADDVLARAAAGGVVQRFRIRTAAGAWLWMEGRPQVIRGADGTPVEVVTQLRDVSARIALEEELRRKHAEAEAAAEAKSQFLANMSHELRTPLTAIVGYAGLLATSGEVSDAGRGYLARVTDAAAALKAIVDQVLEFARLEAGGLDLEAGPFDPASLMSSTVAMFDAVAAAKGLYLRQIAGGGLPPALSADSTRIRQVLVNLIDNAIKFTDAGGVTVRTRYLADQGALRFEVADTGIGVPPAHAQRVFQQFTQVDSSFTRRHGGAGLGLATCKVLVERMGGEIGFESREREGSTFWFAVPAPAAEPVAAAPRPRDGAPPRVLVVDDAPVNRELVAALLESDGCEIAFAEDGAQALDLARARPFDLILMDMQMPVMDGPTATARIRQEPGPNRDTPIVAVSANVLPMHVEACLEAGMDDHVPKPIGIQNLLTKVRYWSGRRSPAARGRAS